MREPDAIRDPMANDIGSLDGAGEAGALIRALRWGTCPLGPYEGWPVGLRAALDLLLPSSAQVVLFWGLDHVALYNDAYAPTIGDKHPRAMGRPARENWGELWSTLGPMLDGVRRTGQTLHARDHPFLITRHGYLEEVFFDISYSPVRESGSVAGVLCVVSETTGRVQGERRMRSLRAAALRLAVAGPPSAVCRAALGAVVAENPADLPWGRIQLTGDAVIAAGPVPDLPPDAVEALVAGATPAAFETADGSPGLVLPLTAGGEPAGWLLAGVNPHLSLAGDYTAFLGLLAGQVSLALTRLRGEAADRDAARQVRESEARFRNMADHAPVMVWVTDAAGRCVFLSRRWYDFTGQIDETGLGFGWLDAVHPEDAPAAEATFRRATVTQSPFQIEYRLRAADGRHHWMIDAAAPRFEADGRFAGFIGSVLDNQDRRLAEEARDLLSRELSHRIKNSFQVVGGLAALAARGDPAAEAFARRLGERLRALALAHDLVQSEGGAAPTAPSVHALIRLLMAPYRGAGGERVLLVGDDRPVGAVAADALALTLHEQATNAMKYGALSAPDGRVRVTTGMEGDDYRLEWREEGGPPVVQPSHQGFGTALSARNVAGQLKGRLTHEWRPEGLVVRLEVPAAALAR